MFYAQVACTGFWNFHHYSSWRELLVTDMIRKDVFWNGKDGIYVLILGKPLVGRPIAIEQVNAPPMTSRLGCGSSILAPTWWMSGRRINAATVWEMKVAMTSISDPKTRRTLYRLKPSTRSVISSATVSNKPEDSTALPRQSPPAARMMMVQRKLLKSSFVSMPVPKNTTSGIMAITPISPKVFSSWWLTHHRTMVSNVMNVINHCTPVYLSFTDRMGTMTVPRPGRNVTSRIIHIRKIEMIQTGREIKNHVPQLIAGDMF